VPCPSFVFILFVVAKPYGKFCLVVMLVGPVWFMPNIAMPKGKPKRALRDLGHGLGMQIAGH